MLISSIDGGNRLTRGTTPTFGRSLGRLILNAVCRVLSEMKIKLANLRRAICWQSAVIQRLCVQH